MSSEKIDVWIKRLRDSNIIARREAIRHLEAIGDSAALGPLAAVFALDVDMETRKLAQWAGKSIYTATEKRATLESGATAEDRRRAAEILEKARAKKNTRSK